MSNGHIIKQYRYKRLDEANWHYLQMKIETYNDLINEFGSIRNYLSSLIREKLEIELL